MEQKLPPPVLIDVMCNGRFVCQIKYPHKGTLEMIDGKIKEVYDCEDIKAFVLEKRPSLIGKNIKLAFSNSRV